VGEVVRFVEGPHTGKGRPRRKAETPFSDMWQDVDRAISEIIDKTTFADLLRGWTDKQNKFVLNWEI
jgi:DNA-binding IscR family transcriptional regulator